MNKDRLITVCGIILLIACAIWDYSLYKSNETIQVVETMSKGSMEEKKVVYLTFDDGPSSNTDKILDILEENGARATFFMIGNQINKNYDEVLERLLEGDNQIGVHTYSHEAGEIYKSADAYYKDVMKTRKVIRKYTGIEPDIYRFPWGSNNCYVKSFVKDVVAKLKKKGMKYCDWNVSGEDSVGKPTAANIIANVKNNYKVYNQPVVLLHDSASCDETVKALQSIIKLYKEAGYSFGVISERNRVYQWKLE